MIHKLLTLLLLSLPLYAQTNTFIPFGGVNSQTATYVIQASDVGKLVVMNCSACTASLPSSIPTGYNAQWAVWILNLNSTPLTVNPNGLQLNGSSSNITLNTNASIYITTSASAYFGVQGSIGSSPGGGLAAPPAIGLPVRFSYTFARADGTPSTAAGHGIGCGSTAQNNSFTGSATETSGRTLTSSASASTNTVIDCGSAGGANPGQGFVTIGTSIRFSQRLLTQVTTNFRYWIGVMDASGVEYTGGNSTWASDAPSRSYCNFRLSASTDTTWKAICANSGTQTIVDTGIAPSTTASMVFEITFTPVLAPTQANFFINGTQVATITTNLPSTSANLSYGFMSDNKNTATAGSVVYFWNQYFEK